MKIFNTEFEVSMRILLLLNEFSVPLDKDKILYLDYFTINAKNYEISQNNINGDGMYMLNGLTVQYSLIKSSIKSLVLQGLISVRNTIDGYMYSISNEGKSFCKDMTSDYSKLYKENAKATFIKTHNWDITKIKKFAKEKEEELNAILKNKQTGR